ncbi:MAG: HD domain-containing protein [Desulfobacterota bacterium]|nr:HD domain-containing protein [Thermodesulfobacteriota bacterium]
MQEVANFLFEAGMLKRTPRTGHQFLGSGSESVAEHICRTVFVGYALARLAGNVDEQRVIKMCLLHDLHEARTGDVNYMNKKYVQVDEDKAVSDLCRTIPFGEDIKSLVDEFKRCESEEARLAYDADQIELILMLKEHKDLGNTYADEWIAYALKRLKTNIGMQLAQNILTTDSTAWWFHDKSDWWVNGGRPTTSEGKAGSGV